MSMSVFDFVLGMVVMTVIFLVHEVLHKIRVSIEIKEKNKDG